jgi:hypothetical protein
MRSLRARAQQWTVSTLFELYISFAVLFTDDRAVLRRERTHLTRVHCAMPIAHRRLDSQHIILGAPILRVHLRQ